tara:strand:- start:196 stop:609 length:414 start_codon:yes stop_codon:yes gene_type:complete
MATIPLMHGGYKLRGKRELSIFDIVGDRGKLYTDQQGSDQNFGSLQNHINAPALRNNAYQTFDVGKVLGCKEEETARNVLRPEPVPDEIGMYPHVGYARHQPVGLAYLSEKPNYGPLMPLAHSAFPNMNSTLGQPPA